MIDDLEHCSSEWLRMESDLRALEHYIHTIYEVTIIDYRFQLDFESVHVNGDKAVVRLREGNEIYYKRLPTEPSKMANVEHEIWLVKTKTGWRITNDKYSNVNTRVLEGSSLVTLFENVRRNHANQHEEIEENYPPPSKSRSSTDMRFYEQYGRAAAVDYADTYWNQDQTDGPVPQMILDKDGWYSGWDTTYKECPLDCTNFVSQAVFEAVSFTATDPNYFYPNSNYNEDWYYKFSAPADGSKPWVSVGDFREFLTVNQYNYETYGLEYVKRGPTGKAVNFCNIQLGDVIFMYEYVGEETGWAHTVIVDKITGNTCSGNNVFVAAHSYDYYQEPLSTYSAYLWYPVEMKGYFDDERVAFLPLASGSSGSLLKNQVQNPYPYPATEGMNKLFAAEPVAYPYPAP
jgi:hypothetical protein